MPPVRFFLAIVFASLALEVDRDPRLVVKPVSLRLLPPGVRALL